MGSEWAVMVKHAKYETYDPTSKPTRIAESIGAQYRIAVAEDVAGIARLHAQRLGGGLDAYIDKITADLEATKGSDDQASWVATKGSEVVGFARLRRIGWEESMRDFPSEPGWYQLGLIVEKRRRRMGVGTVLSRLRFEWLRKRGAAEVYSMISAENLSSVAFHKSLGFEMVREGAGFLSVRFDCGKGFLARKSLIL